MELRHVKKGYGARGCCGPAEQYRTRTDQTGKSIDEIATERNFSVSTIEGHLCSFLITGEVVIGQLVDLETQKKIIAIIDEIGPLSSKTIKERLDDSISYGQVKAALEQYKISNNSNE